MAGHGGAAFATKNDIPDENIVTVTDIGLTSKEVHEARQIRDAEEATEAPKPSFFVCSGNLNGLPLTKANQLQRIETSGVKCDLRFGNPLSLTVFVLHTQRLVAVSGIHAERRGNSLTSNHLAGDLKGGYLRSVAVFNVSTQGSTGLPVTSTKSRVKH